MNRRKFMQFLGAATAGLAVTRKTLTYAELKAMYDKAAGQRFIFFKSGRATGGRILSAVNIQVAAPRLTRQSYGMVCATREQRFKMAERLLREANNSYFERFGV